MNKEALISINKDGTEVIILTEDGFCASLVEGVWYEAILYCYHDMEDFVTLTDDSECSAVLLAAREALSVYSPSPPGDKFAHLIEPLDRLHKSLEHHKVGPLEQELEHFRQETIREWARLSLHRYSLRTSWIALLLGCLNSKILMPYPEALREALEIAQAIHLITPTSENLHER